MDTKLQLMCTWSGLLFATFVGIGWWLIAGYIPPHSPTYSATEIAALYQQDTVRIRFGLFIAMTGCLFYLPWASIISEKIADIEAPSRLLSKIQMACGALNVLLFGLPVMLWAITAFRPDRNPELTLLLNDMAWILFVGFFSPFILIPVTIAIATLIDKRPQPFFPRWSAYFNLWCAILFIPGGLVIFFKSGPFAWNGLLAFWMPLGIIGAWLIVMFILLRKGIKLEAQS